MRRLSGDMTMSGDMTIVLNENLFALADRQNESVTEQRAPSAPNL